MLSKHDTQSASHGADIALTSPENVNREVFVESAAYNGSCDCKLDQSADCEH